MAYFGRGIKASIAAGIVYIVISVILAATIPRFHHKFFHLWDLMSAAGFGIPLVLTASSFVFFLFIPYIARGLIFGAVFAALYNLLPGATSVVKGVVLSLFLWIVLAVQSIYMALGADLPTATVGFATVSLASISLASVSIISTLVFGALTGFLWDRFRVKKLAEARRGNDVLLVSFILGGVLWAHLATSFLIGVVIRGAPIIGPDPHFAGILAASTVFLGPIGWVPALVAWRKTKGGESGFKWGVAGGVIMALTGIMLLPGILAIIGECLARANRVSHMDINTCIHYTYSCRSHLQKKTTQNINPLTGIF